MLGDKRRELRKRALTTAAELIRSSGEGNEDGWELPEEDRAVFYDECKELHDKLHKMHDKL